jgi:hypothetical protein
LYPASPDPPVVSTTTLQLRFIWLDETAVAVNPDGTGGAVVSRIIVSEYGDVFGFPAPSLYHTYTVFVPSPLVNVHAFDVA